MSDSPNNTYTVSASARIDAAPARVYGIIADYRNGHPRILPKEFTSLTVESGGVGNGTVTRISMRVLGRRLVFRGFVTEPEPGRVLVERHVGDSDSVTSFTVDQGSTSEQAVVTIASEFADKPGLLGAIERYLATKTIQGMYRRELKLLDEVARGVE